METLFSRIFGRKKTDENEKVHKTGRVNRQRKETIPNEAYDVKDCIKFANENPVCFLATLEEDQPRVRALGFWFADESGFYFQSSTMKEFIGQLERNKKAEVCFYKHEGMIGSMMRISGEIEFINNIKLKERVLQDRPFLKSFGLTIEDPSLVIFRFHHGKAHFWTMQSNMKSKEIIEF